MQDFFSSWGGKLGVFGLLHLILLGFLIFFMVMLHGEGLMEHGWMLSPLRCTLWVDGMCVPVSSGDLAGQLPEYERLSFGLFSSIHPSFLCLSVSVLSFAFSLQSHDASVYPEHTWQILKHLAIAVVSVFGALYLFMQEHWALPLNNVMLVELQHLGALLFLGTYSWTSDTSEPYEERVMLVNSLLTYPLLAIAALTTAGVDDTVIHLSVLGSLTLAFVLLLLGSLLVRTPGVMGGILVAFWMCCLPWLVWTTRRLHQLTHVSSWVATPLWLVLFLYLLGGLLVTFQLQSLGNVFSMSTNSCLSVAILRAHTFSILDFVIKASITLSIVLGLYIDLR